MTWSTTESRFIEVSRGIIDRTLFAPINKLSVLCHSGHDSLTCQTLNGCPLHPQTFLDILISFLFSFLLEKPMYLDGIFLEDL